MKSLHPVLFSCLGCVGLGGLPIVVARLTCFTTFDCEQKIRKGSNCIDGFCTNPYHVRGCLPNHLEYHYKIRTCHSEDPSSAVENGYCLPGALGYKEVRVASQNWDSAIFAAWVLQIFLSEFLDIPVSIETGKSDIVLDFYDINTSFDYGTGNDWEAVRRSREVTDCRKVKNSDEYLPCSHVVPEAWKGHAMALSKMDKDGVIEKNARLGCLGEQMWFIRRNTALKYPAFLSYMGLRGEENRRLLAEVFKRPTTWEDYCTFVSADSCKTPDKYAKRAPAIEGEGGKYFVEGEYTGFFRATEQNDCENNKACTGHILDYPCEWVSFIKQQAFHNDIAVESNGPEPSGGYSYGEMIQIWNAANATDSDVLMLWWKPETLYHEYMGTDSEFQSVALPSTTQRCFEHRIDPASRCGDDPKLQIGDPLGACAEGPESLQKVVSTALFDISFESDKPEALHSPAYDAVMNFQLSELQIGQIFEYWLERDLDKFGLDNRLATCQWVVENIDILVEMIPRSHPRIIKDDEDAYKEPVFYGAIVLANIAIFGTICGSVGVFIQRQKPAIRYAQIEFLFLLLIGLFLVSIGSLLTALPPSDPVCVAIPWFVNLGYTLELVPLIIKVGAINQLMVASRQMRRVKLSRAPLLGAVLVFFLLVGVCLMLWTILDSPQKVAHLELTEEKSQDGETIISQVYYCSSDNETWNLLGVSWQVLLLFIASIMVFQVRKVREDINETKTLAVMIYSQTILVVLRAMTYLLDGSLGYANVSASRSIIYSIDVLTTLVIYLIPKFGSKETRTNSWVVFNSGGLQESSTPGQSEQSETPTVEQAINFRNSISVNKCVDGGRIPGEGSCSRNPSSGDFSKSRPNRNLPTSDSGQL